MASPELQLESLFVGIYANIEDFTSKIPKIEGAVDAIEKSLNTLVAISKAVGIAFGDMATAMVESIAPVTTPIVEFILRLRGGIVLVQQDIVAFGSAMSKVATGGMVEMSLALSRIGNFLNAVTATTSFKKIEAIVAPLQTFVQGFKNSIAGLVTAEVALAAKALGKIGSLANSITKMNIDNVQVSNLGTALSSIFSVLQTGGTAAVGVAGEAIGRLGRGLAALSKADPTALAALGTPLTNLLTALGAAPAATLVPITTALGSLGRSLKAITAINPATLVAVGNAIKTFLLALASVPVPPNLPKIAQLLTQISSAARGASNAIGSIGGGIPPVKNVAAATAGVGSAAQAAGNRVGWFSGRLNNMATAAGSANVRLNTLKLTLAGFAGYGLSLFAKFDDSVTKMMAHAGIFDKDKEGEPNKSFAGTRESIVSGVMGISSNSIFGATALTKALDLLTVSGQSAGMAIESLKITETFATASSMDLEIATRKLVNLQRSIGNERIIGKGSGDEVQDYYKSIAKLGDLLVGVSRQVGSTEEKMTKAFTGHFYNAMQRANLSIEQSLALLGVYSQASEDFQGSGGGDAVSRAINALMNKGVEEYVNWQQMTARFGGIFNKEGKLKDIDVVADILGKTIGGGGSVAQTAKMVELKIVERRTQDAILPIIGKGDEIRKLMEAMKEMGGLQKVVADMIRRDFLSQMKILWNNVSNAGTVIGTHLAPAIGMVGKGIESLTRAFTNLNPALQNLIVWGTTFTLLLRPMIGLVTRLVSSFVVGPVMAVGSALFTIGAGLWTIAKIGWNAAIAVGTFLVGIPAGIAKAANFAVSAMGTIWSVAKTTWGLFTAPVRIIEGLWIDITYLVKNFGRIMFNIVEGLIVDFMYLGRLIAQGFVATLAGIVPALISVGAFFMNLASWMLILIPAIALVGSVIATVFVGIVQLFSAIGSGIARAWSNIRENAGRMAGQAADGMVRAGKAAAEMWDRAKPQMISFWEDTLKSIKMVAGFLWNFQHNMEIMITWLGDNWNELAADMGNNFVKMIDNIVHNIKTLASLIGDIAAPIFGGFWKTFKFFGEQIWSWFSNEWSNVLEDMGTLFKAFVSNLAQNFMIVATAMGKIAKHNLFGRTEEDVQSDIEKLKWIKGVPLGDRNIFGQDTNPNRNAVTDREYARLVEEKRKITASKESILGDMISKLKGPFEGVGDMKANYSWLGKIPGFTASVGGDFMSKAWDAVTKVMAKPGGFKSPFADFKDTTAPILGLILDLPKTPQKLAEFIKTALGGGKGIGDEASEVSGKSQPGFTFKQISLARTMLGGEAAMQLDFQQLVTLKLIASKLDQMIELAKGKQIYTGPTGEASPQPWMNAQDAVNPQLTD